MVFFTGGVLDTGVKVRIRKPEGNTAGNKIINV
jgi:hypothetical protein